MHKKGNFFWQNFQKLKNRDTYFFSKVKLNLILLGVFREHIFPPTNQNWSSINCVVQFKCLVVCIFVHKSQVRSNNLFVTSKKETMNSPIHEIKVRKMSLKGKSKAYIVFKGSPVFMQHFKFVNWRIRGFVFWCHEQVRNHNFLFFCRMSKVFLTLEAYHYYYCLTLLFMIQSNVRA